MSGSSTRDGRLGPTGLRNRCNPRDWGRSVRAAHCTVRLATPGLLLPTHARESVVRLLRWGATAIVRDECPLRDRAAMTGGALRVHGAGGGGARWAGGVADQEPGLGGHRGHRGAATDGGRAAGQ